MIILLQQLQLQLSFIANKENAIKMAAYMKNNFEFYGIPTKERRMVTKAFFTTLPKLNEATLLDFVTQLWQQPQREFHYIAIELLANNTKEWTETTIVFVEKLLITNSWWDSVDAIASFILTPYFKKFPQQIIPITSRWNKNQNLWLQRSSIMFQKAFKQNTDTILLEKFILNCAKSNQFFIQKAIGWALREYAKTNSPWVIDFVANNDLPKLSQREAMKHLS